MIPFCLVRNHPGTHILAVQYTHHLCSQCFQCPHHHKLVHNRIYRRDSVGIHYCIDTYPYRCNIHFRTIHCKSVYSRRNNRRLRHPLTPEFHSIRLNDCNCCWDQHRNRIHIWPRIVEKTKIISTTFDMRHKGKLPDATDNENYWNAQMETALKSMANKHIDSLN